MPSSSASMRARGVGAAAGAGAGAAAAAPGVGRHHHRVVRAPARGAAGARRRSPRLTLPVGTASGCGSRRRALESAFRSMPRRARHRLQVRLRAAHGRLELLLGQVQRAREAVADRGDLAGGAPRSAPASAPARVRPTACTHQRSRSGADVDGARRRLALGPRDGAAQRVGQAPDLGRRPRPVARRTGPAPRRRRGPRSPATTRRAATTARRGGGSARPPRGSRTR